MGAAVKPQINAGDRIAGITLANKAGTAIGAGPTIDGFTATIVMDTTTHSQIIARKGIALVRCAETAEQLITTAILIVSAIYTEILTC